MFKDEDASESISSSLIAARLCKWDRWRDRRCKYANKATGLSYTQIAVIEQGEDDEDGEVEEAPQSSLHLDTCKHHDTCH